MLEDTTPRVRIPIQFEWSIGLEIVEYFPSGRALWSWICSASRHNPYPSYVSDEKWSVVVSYLTLMKEAARLLEHSLRELFNAPRYVNRYGIALRAMPNDFSPLGCGVHHLSVGWHRNVSRPWRKICGPCCA